MKMGRKIPALLSILVHLNKGGRNGFTIRSKKEVICRQKGKCALCGGKMNRWERDFDHKNGDSSNNKMSNCRATHTRCHRKKHAREACKRQNRSIYGWGLIKRMIIRK